MKVARGIAARVALQPYFAATVAGDGNALLESRARDWPRAGLAVRPWGNWSRKLELPKEMDPAKIVAQFENRVLRVRVPKATKVQPVRIAIGGPSKASSLPKGRG